MFMLFTLFYASLFGLFFSTTYKLLKKNKSISIAINHVYIIDCH